MPKPRLLLVDPDDHAREALCALLRDSGYSVEAVPDGLSGLAAARLRPPDLLVVELWPLFSASVQMLERLREAGVGGTPVVVVTSAVAAEYRARAMEAGCAAYLEKPCDPVAVLRAISRLLDRTPARMAVSAAERGARELR